MMHSTKITVVSSDVKFLVDLTRFIEQYPRVEPESTTISYGEVPLDEDALRKDITTAINKIQSIYRTVNLYDEPKQRLISKLLDICKSLCLTLTWSSQSDASTQTD